MTPAAAVIATTLAACVPLSSVTVKITELPSNADDITLIIVVKQDTAPVIRTP